VQHLSIEILPFFRDQFSIFEVFPILIDLYSNHIIKKRIAHLIKIDAKKKWIFRKNNNNYKIVFPSGFFKVKQTRKKKLIKKG
jgi:hypothetical protein